MENTKKLIIKARLDHPEDAIVNALCDALLVALDDRLKLNEDLKNLRQNLEIKDAAAYPVSTAQQMFETLIEETRKLTNPNPAGIPAMSPECFRQHVAIAALNGLLTTKSQFFDSIDDVVSNAVIVADTLVKELAK